MQTHLNEELVIELPESIEEISADSIKEISPADSIKEISPADSIKEISPADSIKEISKKQQKNH